MMSNLRRSVALLFQRAWLVGLGRPTATNNPGIVGVSKWSPDAMASDTSRNAPPGVERAIAVTSVGLTSEVEILEVQMPTDGLTHALFRLRFECP